MNIADPLALRARDKPDALALIAGPAAISFAQLNGAINRFAFHLMAQGVRPYSVIGISLPASPVHLMAVYALARLGTVHVVLPPADSSAARTALARRFGVETVLCSHPDQALAGIPMLLVDRAWFDSGPTDPPPVATNADTPWKILLSSGTTAAPKAVSVTHRIEFGWHSRGRPDFAAVPGSRFLSLVDMNFSYGLRLHLHALNSGACVVLSQADGPGALLRELDAHAITHVGATPRHLMDLAALLPEGGPRNPGLRYLSVAGSIMPEGLRRIIRSRLTPNLHIKYGNNESGYLIESSPELIERYPDVLGRPVAGVQYQIVDDHGQEVRRGETGIIRFRAAAFPTAYIDNPAATAFAFRDGWLAPGDLAREGADGEIYFMGRADDMMNFDGVKLYPVDIEARLLEHPSVAEAAAFPIASERFQDVPAAAVVLRSSAPAVTVQELLAFCSNRLGARSPRIVRIVPGLPKNAMGKVVRRNLTEAFAAKPTALHE